MKEGSRQRKPKSRKAEDGEPRGLAKSSGRPWEILRVGGQKQGMKEKAQKWESIQKAGEDVQASETLVLLFAPLCLGQWGCSINLRISGPALLGSLGGDPVEGTRESNSKSLVLPLSS